MAKRKASTEVTTDDAEPPRRSTRAHTSRTAPAPKKATSPAPAKPKTAAAKPKKSKAALVKDVAAASPPVAGSAAADVKPAATDGRQYWLMKAEPETRFENGVDVSFSIDDLAAKKVPEPWDGIRNYVARNNLRAMKKGDLAFFWHSNCKEPGIVGTMEIVQEHSPDLSANDSKSAYHDPKPTTAAGEPKWSVVHVEFRRKFATPIMLKEMRGYAEAGGPLAGMQMMKQSRLSVSRVSAEEWDFLMGLVEEKAKE